MSDYPNLRDADDHGEQYADHWARSPIHELEPDPEPDDEPDTEDSDDDD